MSLVNGQSRPTGTTTPASDWWMFFRKFVKHGTKIASFAPSSRYLSRKICQGIDYTTAQCIVELAVVVGRQRRNPRLYLLLERHR